MIICGYLVDIYDYMFNIDKLYIGLINHQFYYNLHGGKLYKNELIKSNNIYFK